MPTDGQNLAWSLAQCQPTHHEAMMALRASRTSAAARRCWGSRTSSFRMRHTVFSETRPSLMQERERAERAQEGQAGAASGPQDSRPHCVVPHIKPEGPGLPALPREAVLTQGWCTRQP